LRIFDAGHGWACLGMARHGKAGRASQGNSRKFPVDEWSVGRSDGDIRGFESRRSGFHSTPKSAAGTPTHDIAGPLNLNRLP
jgi:hypothetical protein